jgi:hypothetical protein
MNTTRAIAAALTLALAASTASAQVVVNGNFEGSFTAYGNGTPSTVPNGWQLGPPGSPGPSNMTVASGFGPLTNQGPQSGSQYMVFKSPATSGWDCLYQDLNTTAGLQYTVSFYVAIAPGTAGGTPPGLHPVWDENTANSTILGPSNSYYAPASTFSSAYQFYSFTETASGNLTRLDFHGIDATGAIFLDSVSVTPVPEPSSLVFVAACLVAALRPWRRKTGAP